jgi:hypothetical protein
MNTNSPFSPDLALKRRGLTIPPRTSSRSPFGEDHYQPTQQEALQAAWDKLYRARALLEAEQQHLRDDRISLQGELESLTLREGAVIAREQRLQQIEAQMELERFEAEQARQSQTTIGRITRAPFEMAKSVFTAKK